MKKRYKYGELFDAIEPLGELLKQKMPVKSSYQLAVFANKVNEFTAPLEVVRRELITQYGEQKDGKWEVDARSEKAREFQEKLEELFGIETEEWQLNKVRLPDELEVEPSVLMPLVKLGIVEIV